MATRRKGWFEAHVEGVGQLTRDMRRLGDYDLREVMRQTTRAAVNEEIVPEVQARVPVDKGKLRGTVNASKSTASKGKIKVGTPKIWYGWMVHAGHRLPSGREYPGVPFLRDGISAGFGNYVNRYIEAIDPVIRQFNKRHRSKFPTR